MLEHDEVRLDVEAGTEQTNHVFMNKVLKGVSMERMPEKREKHSFDMVRNKERAYRKGTTLTFIRQASSKN